MDNKTLLDMLRLVLDGVEWLCPRPADMFRPMEPFFRAMGMESAIIYFDDDFPDAMQNVFSYGDTSVFPDRVVRSETATLMESLRRQMKGVPGFIADRIRVNRRELGAIAAIGKDPVENFDILVHFISLMSLIERGRRNFQREREEREVFFAQSLANRLLLHRPPEVKNLRFDCQFIRSLECSGEFYDVIPRREDDIFGMFGCCNGHGLRTVMAVNMLMREIRRFRESCRHLSDVVRGVNAYLLRYGHRMRQASLCLFEIDMRRRRLHLAKAGRLGIILGGAGIEVKNVSAGGGIFLGLYEDPAIQDETFEFRPGHSILMATEGFYHSRNSPTVRPQLRWFLQAVENAMARSPDSGVSLAKATVDNLKAATDYSPESMLTLSIESTERKTTRVFSKKTRRRARSGDKEKKDEPGD
ncbi:MAG: serine/threonine-protein phosphatase [Planctomycetota bacterium]|jgi:serine phosphatase RsbU (regulator of sigma subunit)|nr:serine/threonine-protein phosphatase [Planctomycetota bacterium]